MSQINDHRGNSFTPSRDQAALYKAGWRITQRRKMGCMWIVEWRDPVEGGVWRQGTAVDIMKGRKRVNA